MNGAIQTASPLLDKPWPRLVWITPLAIAIWFALLLGFGLLLKGSVAPLEELEPVEARIVEIPPPVGGPQGRPAAEPHTVAPAPTGPKPRVEMRRKAVLSVNPHKKRAVLEAPPSLAGTRKEAPAEPDTKAAPASAGTESGVVPQNQGAVGSGSGSGLGSDSFGARAIYSPVPKIPHDLPDQAFAAMAIAHFDVSYDGDVKVTLVKPTPDPRLNQILLSTLWQWRFFPAIRGGVVIDSSFDLRIPVTLQ